MYQWSPDSTRIAYSSDGIYVMAVDTGVVQRVTTKGFDDNPDWSPDGSRIAFDRDLDTIYTIAADGSNLKKIGEGTSPKWSPDGS